MTNNKPHLFRKGNKGRPVGAVGKKPDAKLMALLLDMCTENLIDKFDKLTLNQQIRLVSMFSKSFQDDNVIMLQDVSFEFATD